LRKIAAIAPQQAVGGIELTAQVYGVLILAHLAKGCVA
jgi:hypothetical protein